MSAPAATVSVDGIERITHCNQGCLGWIGELLLSSRYQLIPCNREIYALICKLQLKQLFGINPRDGIAQHSLANESHSRDEREEKKMM